MDGTEPLYDSIGRRYAMRRRPDPRVATQIAAAIGDARSVLNVGAGTGNYEPDDRFVVALEPSPTMLAQRSDAHPAVRGVAERLPFADDVFDLALGILTVHHWSDRAAGLAELARVAPRQVCVVYDTEVSAGFWLLEFFPDLATAPWEVDAPTPEVLARHLVVDDVHVLWVPADCSDGFSGAFWNRPERYLDPEVQGGMSTLARLDPAARAAGTQRLRTALDTGEWDRRHGHLRSQDRFDMGYRIVVSHRP